MPLLPRFEYFRPKTLVRALRLISDHAADSRILAGGTDLFVQMKKGLLKPSVLIDIKQIRQLNRISSRKDGALLIGAAVTLSDLESWTKSKNEWYGLSVAAGSIGSQQVRNRATVVGNVCRASPAGDMAPVLIAYDARVEIKGPSGGRSLPVEQFINGPGQTVLQPGEIAVGLRIPKPPPCTAVAYIKHGARRAMEIAIVSVAARISLNGDGRIHSARLVLGSVAPIPLRIQEIEEILVKEGVSSEALEKISAIAVARAAPITDIRASAWYRSELVGVLTRRAIEQAYSQVRPSGVKA